MKKLTTIIANNGETLWWAQKNEFVSYVDDIVEKVSNDTNDILLFVTEATSQQLRKIDKKFIFWSSDIQHIFQKENTWMWVFSNNPYVEINIWRYPDLLQNEERRIIFDDDGAKYATVDWWDYVWSFQHLNPYAWPKGLQWVLDDWNEFRIRQFEFTRSIMRQKYLKTNPKNPFLDKVIDDWFEFHNGYRSMYGSIVKNLLFKRWDAWGTPQREFIEDMEEYNLQEVHSGKQQYTFNGTMKWIWPVKFKWSHALVSENVVNQSETRTLAPIEWWDRSTIITTIDYE